MPKPTPKPAPKQVKLAPMAGGFKFGGDHRNPEGKAYLFGLAVRRKGWG